MASPSPSFFLFSSRAFLLFEAVYVVGPWEGFLPPFASSQDFLNPLSGSACPFKDSPFLTVAEDQPWNSVVISFFPP